MNLAVSPRSGGALSYHVVEATIRDKISIASAPGLVLQDDQGLLGLQVIDYRLRSRSGKVQLFRSWSSLLARRLPDGPPSVWLDGEEEPLDLRENSGDWYQINGFRIEAVVGPYVSLYGHRTSETTGLIYLRDEWPAQTLAAPDGQRATLPVVVGAAAVAGLVDRLKQPNNSPPSEQLLGADLGQFGLSFDRADEKTPGLTLLTGSESPMPGVRAALEHVPPGLQPHLRTSSWAPLAVGHPRSCAEIALDNGALRVRRPGDTSETKVVLPPSLRTASFLGVAWVSMEDSFSLSQLAPSGDASREPVARSAPPVKFSFK